MGSIPIIKPCVGQQRHKKLGPVTEIKICCHGAFSYFHIGMEPMIACMCGGTMEIGVIFFALVLVATSFGLDYIGFGRKKRCKNCKGDSPCDHSGS